MLIATDMSTQIQQKFASYPSHIQPILLRLRALIVQVADEEAVNDLSETLKWGQPSYLAKNASTLRMDWSPNSASVYCLFFTCSSKLVDTFKQLYPNQLSYQGNRAIVLSLEQNIDSPALKHCIAMTLNYQKIKHLPLLGN